MQGLAKDELAAIATPPTPSLVPLLSPSLSRSIQHGDSSALELEGVRTLTRVWRGAARRREAVHCERSAVSPWRSIGCADSVVCIRARRRWRLNEGVRSMRAHECCLRSTC